MTHVEAILSHVKAHCDLNVVVDCGNGATSILTPYLLKDLGCKVTTLNTQLDGFFPGRPPEPSPENLQNLIKIVKATNSNLGIAHDGDGDRVVIIDNNGNFVSTDRLFGLMACNIVKENKGGVIVTTIDASMCIDETVEKYGGKVIRTKVGDIAVADSVVRNNAILGGEPSGTFIFPQVNLCPDGPFVAAKIIELLCETKTQISDLLKEIPEYPILREKVQCPLVSKEQIMQKIKARVCKTFQHAIIEEIDGVKLNFKDSWVLVRLSGTESVIRLVVETKSKEKAENMLLQVKELVEKEVHSVLK